MANNAMEHWDIYFAFVITNCCFKYLTVRKQYCTWESVAIWDGYNISDSE